MFDVSSISEGPPIRSCVRAALHLQRRVLHSAILVPLCSWRCGGRLSIATSHHQSTSSPRLLAESSNWARIVCGLHRACDIFCLAIAIVHSALSVDRGIWYPLRIPKRCRNAPQASTVAVTGSGSRNRRLKGKRKFFPRESDQLRLSSCHQYCITYSHGTILTGLRRKAPNFPLLRPSLSLMLCLARSYGAHAIII